MEPQTKITNSPEQNQAKPPLDNFRSIITSPRYWLAALLPLLGLLPVFVIQILRLGEFFSSEFDSSDLIYFGYFC